MNAIRSLYWIGFTVAFLSYGATRSIRWVDPRKGGDGLYIYCARILSAALVATVWPAEAIARILLARKRSA